MLDSFMGADEPSGFVVCPFQRDRRVLTAWEVPDADSSPGEGTVYAPALSLCQDPPQEQGNQAFRILQKEIEVSDLPTDTHSRRIAVIASMTRSASVPSA